MSTDSGSPEFALLDEISTGLQTTRDSWPLDYFDPHVMIFQYNEQSYSASSHLDYLHSKNV